MADFVLDLGQIWRIAIGGGGGGVDKTFHAFVAGGYQHVQKARDVAAVRKQRVVDGAGHGTQGGLVQHMVDALADLAAGIQITDVAFHKGEATPGFRPHQVAHHIQIFLVAGEKVVQTHHGLAHAQQVFQQVGADKAGHARDQPARGLRRQVSL